jgi:beta-galactosidase
VWTGFDYRGEPSPYQWPNISSQYGIIDTCGFPKDTFYYYQSWWTSKPVLHLFPHWNWPGMEGQEIAVWVHSNLDTVELFLNGRSLGAQETKRDSHLAWIVKYAPGAIEARGTKDGKQVMTVKRETTGAASRLVLKPDRDRMSADGEDVAMFAVEVQDAQGRVVPVADNEVTFRVTGEGKLIGVGNGDPTSHEPDKADSRRAFSGLCMAIVQSAKAAGNITVEATSPGLSAASATISSKAVRIRPQVGVWEREVPAGPGITGLWRPVPAAAVTPQFLFGGGAGQVFTLVQEGNTVKGTVEGAAFGGGDTPVLIEEGRVDGNTISFKAGNTTYKGMLEGDQLQLERAGGFGGTGRPVAPGTPAAPAAPRPAIGPPPDGTDPSRGVGGGGRLGQAPGPLILRRAKR